MGKIHVTAPGGDYDIFIGQGLLAQVAQNPAAYHIKNPIILTNDTIAPLHTQAIADTLGAAVICMQDGEQYKNMATTAAFYADLIANGADRHTTVIALGGGVVGDTAGFVAATYMRGIDFVQAPTSLLAMVDSSVGGKVGIDLPQGKNLVGAFKQPRCVVIDTATLQTLPEAEWQNGMAEVIKHGLIADESLLDPALHSRDRADELVARAVQVKVDVVQRDPYEKGERAHLNLGHTFGHAIEQVTQYNWAHGQAVGVGLLAAARLSHTLELCGAALVDRVESTLLTVGLPCRIGALQPEALWAAMSTDKKWRSGVNRFVLLRDIGHPLIMEDVDKHAVIDVLAGLA